MHYCNLVIIENTDNVEAAVEQAMGPSEENGGFWDWYVIGGRYTGVLDGYDPEKDSANLEENGQVKWPTEWKPHVGDIQLVETLTEENYKCYRVVLYDRGSFERQTYIPWNEENPFKENELPPLEWIKKEYEGCLVVVVDNHN